MNNIKPQLGFFSVISMVFCLPIALANIYFRDDLSRADYYFVNLKTIGRPVADFLHDILTAFNSGADLSPLTLIISSMTLAISGFILYKKFSTEKNIIWSIPFLFISCNPFALQGLSYKYDSISISASVLFAIIPFALNIKGKLFSFLFSVLFFFLAIGSYQASINIIISTTCFVLVTQILSERSYREMCSYIIRKIIELVFSFILYLFTINIFFPHTKSRSSIASLDGIIRSINKILNDLILLFDGAQSFYFITLCVVCIAVLIFNFQRCGILKVTAILSLLLAQLISIGGVSILLSEGIVGYRTYLSFGIFMMTISYISIYSGKKLRIFPSIMSTLILIYFISLSFTYGNILSSQRKYEQLLVDDVYNNLSNNNTENKKVYISGRIKTSHMTRSLYKLNGILMNINPIEPWTGRFMLHNLGINVNWTWNSIDTTAIEISNKEDAKVINNNDNYIIYKSGDVFSVIFK
ncbi:glucosyltransferase domain-containing protein [Hafnia paralvei]|uniref:glucosyltransferase domain-containing protein n=1 Tax=Hafnia paralvei TaxID=546367 RepID=UPI0027B9FA0E|nr:glucosyltransferase domain-containing protein [Hafnia paralvei]